VLLAAALLETVALVGGTVHTMDVTQAGDASPATVATILIEDDRIVAIGPDVEVPEGARTIDATGLFLIPGLIDGFVNHDPDHDRLYVASGVTFVRDAGSSLTRILVERTPAARARGPGPDLWVAGAVLDGVPPATTDAVVLATVAEADNKLPRLFEMGIDYASAYNGLTPEVWTRAVELTQTAGLAFWGPRPRDMTLAELCAQKPDGMFHLDGLLAANQSWETVTLDELAPALDLFAASGAALTPTLAVYGQRLIPPKDDAPELDYLGPHYGQAWTADAELRRSLVQKNPKAFVERGLAAVNVQGEVLRELHERGVTLVPGTGSPYPWLMPGQSLLAELSLWRRAGLGQAEILRLATSGAARALGCAEERGTLAPGRLADIVALAADPTKDLDTLRRPSFVVLRGRVLERDDLDRLLDDLRTTQSDLRAQATQPIEVHEPELPEGEVLLAGRVETRAAGQSISAERFAVVREPDGTYAYCGRMRTPGAASYPDSELGITQRIKDGKLTSFAMRIRNGRSMLVIEGQRGPGNLRIMRRFDGKLLDEQKVAEQVAFVEAGSITSHLILGHEAEPGTFRALFFDDADPATGTWELALDATNAHLVRTPGGDVVVRFDERGFPELIVRRQGAAVIEARTTESQTFGGPGLPLPEAKRPREAPTAKTGPSKGESIFGRPQMPIGRTPIGRTPVGQTPIRKTPIEAGGDKSGESGPESRPHDGPDEDP